MGNRLCPYSRIQRYAGKHLLADSWRMASICSLQRVPPSEFLPMPVLPSLAVGVRPAQWSRFEHLQDTAKKAGTLIKPSQMYKDATLATLELETCTNPAYAWSVSSLAAGACPALRWSRCWRPRRCSTSSARPAAEGGTGENTEHANEEGFKEGPERIRSLKTKKETIVRSFCFASMTAL